VTLYNHQLQFTALNNNNVNEGLAQDIYRGG